MSTLATTFAALALWLKPASELDSKQTAALQPPSTGSSTSANTTGSDDPTRAKQVRWTCFRSFTPLPAGCGLQDMAVLTLDLDTQGSAWPCRVPGHQHSAQCHSGSLLPAISLDILLVSGTGHSLHCGTRLRRDNLDSPDPAFSSAHCRLDLVWVRAGSCLHWPLDSCP